MTESDLKNLLRPLMPSILAAVEAKLRAGDVATFAAESDDGPHFRASFTAADVARLSDYYADDAGAYPGTLHRHFGLAVREFADHSKLLRKQITDKNGHRVWHWVRPEQPPASPATKPQAPPTSPATHDLVPEPPSKAGRVKLAVADKLKQTRGGRAVLAMGSVGLKLFHIIEPLLLYASKKVQATVEQAVKERGFPPDRAEKLKHALYMADYLGGYALAAGATTAGLPLLAIKASAFAPSASVLYLAYSTAVNPVATWRAAKRVLADTFHKSTPEEAATHAAQMAAMFSDWDEAKHNRDHGKFAPTEGTSGSESHPPARARLPKPEQVGGRPKSKKARKELADKVQDAWTEARNALVAKYGTRDINDKMSDEEKKAEFALFGTLRVLASGNEHDGPFDLGPVSDQRYVGYYRAALAAADELRGGHQPATHAAEFAQDASDDGFDADAATIADAMQEASDPEMWLAVFCAALGETEGDVPASVGIASAAQHEHAGEEGEEEEEEPDDSRTFSDADLETFAAHKDGDTWTSGNRIYTRSAGKTTWKSANPKEKPAPKVRTPKAAEPAPAPKAVKEKPAPKAKPNPEQVHADLKAAFDDPAGLTPEKVKAVAAQLKTLTVEQIKDIQAARGVKGGTDKAKRVEKIIADAKAKIAAKAKPAAAPAPKTAAAQNPHEQARAVLDSLGVDHAGLSDADVTDRIKAAFAKPAAVGKPAPSAAKGAPAKPKPPATGKAGAASKLEKAGDDLYEAIDATRTSILPPAEADAHADAVIAKLQASHTPAEIHEVVKLATGKKGRKADASDSLALLKTDLTAASRLRETQRV